MRILGVDPGSRFTGFGVVEEAKGALLHLASGRISLNPNADFPQRLVKVLNEIKGIAKEFSPDAVALEDMFYAKNAKSAFKLAHVRGAVMLAAGQSSLEVFEYAPAVVKKAVTGTGAADKRQVQMMVKAILKLGEAPTEDAADALAVAICHLSHAKMKGIV